MLGLTMKEVADKVVCLPDWFSDGLICRFEAVPIKFFK